MEAPLSLSTRENQPPRTLRAPSLLIFLAVFARFIVTSAGCVIIFAGGTYAQDKDRIPHKKIAEFCRRWEVTEFSLFGSVLRDDFRPDSDVDVLVTFAAQRPNQFV